MKLSVSHLILFVLCTAKSDAIAADRYGWPLRDISKTFLVLMMSPEKLDYDAFIRQADQYYGIGLRDDYGNTAMHHLIFRPDATREWVDLLLAKGARLDAVNSYDNTPYYHGITYEVRTPAEKATNRKARTNKKVLSYISEIILHQRLTRIVTQESLPKYKSLKNLALNLPKEPTAQEDADKLEILRIELRRMANDVILKELDI